MIEKFLLGFLLSFLFGVIIAPIFIKVVKKIKAKQTILFYVEAHKHRHEAWYPHNLYFPHSEVPPLYEGKTSVLYLLYFQICPDKSHQQMSVPKNTAYPASML